MWIILIDLGKEKNELKFKLQKRTHNFVNLGILKCNIFTLDVIHCLEKITLAYCPSFSNCRRAFVCTAMDSR